MNFRWEPYFFGGVISTIAAGALIPIFCLAIWPQMDRQHYALLDTSTGKVIGEFDDRSQANYYAAEAATDGKILLSKDGRYIRESVHAVRIEMRDGDVK